MRHAISYIVLILMVTGCSEYGRKIQAEQAAEDNKVCISKGYEQGTQDYADCRTDLEYSRTDAMRPIDDRLPGPAIPNMNTIIPRR